MQVHMTNLKLFALGRRLTAKLCQVAALIGIASSLLFGSRWVMFLILETSVGPYYYLDNLGMEPGLLLLLFLLCFFGTICIQCCSLCIVACAALRAPSNDEAILSTAFLLFGNALLVLLGTALSVWALVRYWLSSDTFETRKWSTWLTVDIFLQICNTLTLSGMVGPKQWNRPMDAFRRLADLSGFGFASKRIAFPGHINRTAAKCIVSFPGKYSELWDEAVSTVSSQAVDTGLEPWSLACVFLTDAESGLGRHSENPDTPGKCWCHSIYGRVPAETYLCVVEVEPEHIDSQANRQLLSFKRSDAEAMGQLLVIKSDQSDTEWQIQLAEAARNAQQLCVEKDGRAPWGCQWFEKWKQNVDLAAQLGQELHVCRAQGPRKGALGSAL
ncbi:Kif11 [Symbiodinium natans]|uniref:Kif11 protein n=1 Tax=Symbiodinium natans TaxID=878477 RepID=A0A812M844_9DINO|nr:Kif11 [Symbiodinium natans]